MDTAGEKLMESINSIRELRMQVRWATASDYLNAAYPSLLSPPDPSPRPFDNNSGVLIKRMGALVSEDPTGDALPYHGKCVCFFARACACGRTPTPSLVMKAYHARVSWPHAPFTDTHINTYTPHVHIPRWLAHTRAHTYMWVADVVCWTHRRARRSGGGDRGAAL
jgi:hypothetical protein